jgi:hypothetical protein
MQPEERLYLVDHFITYCQSHVFHLTSEAESLRREVAQRAYMNAEQLEATLLVMRHAIAEWQLSAADAHALRERMLAGAEHSTPESAPAREAGEQTAQPSRPRAHHPSRTQQAPAG